MSNYCYTPSVAQIVMPQTYEIAAWVEFFAWLMQVDHFAPLHILMAHYEFLYELQITPVPTPYRSLYYDLGIEMAVDGEFPAVEAAIDSGLYARGLAQMVELTNAKDPYFDSYLTILDVVMHQTEDYVAIEDENLRNKAAEMAELYRENLAKQEEAKVPVTVDVQSWIKYFERAMLDDPCARTSILSYFLQEANKHEHRVFCPLGDDRYRAVGEMMRKHENVLDAAIRAGLMVGAVPTYFGAALDVIENWAVMKDGIRFILDSEKLSIFVPFEDRFIAEELLNEFSGGIDPERDEERWREVSHKQRNKFNAKISRGY